MKENRKLRIKLQLDAAAKNYKAGSLTTEEYQTAVNVLTGYMAELDAE